MLKSDLHPHPSTLCPRGQTVDHPRPSTAYKGVDGRMNPLPDGAPEKKKAKLYIEKEGVLLTAHERLVL
jgi:hypothetical protein